MDRVLASLTLLLVLLLLSVLVPVIHVAQQPLVFPRSLRPMVVIENVIEITAENYEYYLNYSYVLNSRDEARQWLEKQLSKSVRVYLLELGVYIVNRSEREPVTVYMGGCTGSTTSVRVIEGDYFIPMKICTLILVVRGIETRGGRLKDGELIFVTAPSRIQAVFETALADFCKSCSENECYKIRFKFEVSTTRDGEFKVSVLSVDYTPTKPP